MFVLARSHEVVEIDDDMSTLISYYEDKVDKPFDQWICGLYKGNIEFYTWLKENYDESLKYTVYCMTPEKVRKRFKEFQIKNIYKPEKEDK